MTLQPAAQPVPPPAHPNTHNPQACTAYNTHSPNPAQGHTSDPRPGRPPGSPAPNMTSTPLSPRPLAGTTGPIPSAHRPCIRPPTRSQTAQPSASRRQPPQVLQP